MSVKHPVAVVLLCAVVLFQASETTAGGGIVSTCVKILWNYVGKPVSKGALTATGGIIAEHFAGRRAEGGEVRISEYDLEQLERKFRQRGLSDCDLRRQLEGLEASIREPPPRRRGYSAIAHCSRTGATGRSYDEDSIDEALDVAIEACIDRGGIPACCEAGARLMR
jgi:hypothetical protein